MICPSFISNFLVCTLKNYSVQIFTIYRWHKYEVTNLESFTGVFFRSYRSFSDKDCSYSPLSPTTIRHSFKTFLSITLLFISTHGQGSPSYASGVPSVLIQGRSIILVELQVLDTHNLWREVVLTLTNNTRTFRTIFLLVRIHTTVTISSLFYWYHLFIVNSFPFFLCLVCGLLLLVC